jgi:hypothetical protein
LKRLRFDWPNGAPGVKFAGIFKITSIFARLKILAITERAGTSHPGRQVIPVTGDISVTRLSQKCFSTRITQI